MKPVSKGMNLPASLDKALSKYSVIYKCPANTQSKFLTLFISNTASGNKIISVELYRPSGAVYIPFLGGQTIAANNYLHIWGGYIVLEADDEIRITKTDAGSAFSIVATFEEEAKPTISNSGIEPYTVGV